MTSDTHTCGGIIRPSSFLAAALDYLLLLPNLFIKLLLSSLYLFGLWCALPKFVLCFIGLEKAMIPFLCIYIQKSYFLTMHYSWGSYPTLCRTPFLSSVGSWFLFPMTRLFGRQTFRLGTLCQHEMCIFAFQS